MPFITVVETVFQGRVAAWREECGKPVLFDTEEEALTEAEEDDMVIRVIAEESRIYDPVDGRVYWEVA